MTEGALRGKRALLTGAAGGIGSAVAQAFVDAGATVLLTDLDPAVAEKAAGLGARGVMLDLADRAAVAELVADAPGLLGGPLTTVVHHAAVLALGPVADIDDDE